MAVLSFTLSEEGVNCLREAITCLSRFHDEVSLEAQRDKVFSQSNLGLGILFKLSTMNPTKSAYACVSFSTARFFAKYRFSGRDRFLCRLYARVLIAIFRGRAGPTSFSGADIAKDAAVADSRAATIDHCTITVEDGPGVKSRFVVMMAFRNGCMATHRLTFESAAVVHARFNTEEAVHRWTIASRTLRQIMEHFGPGVELLDINSTDKHVNFNCYTEKAVNADEVLKKPLQTSIAVDLDEFQNIEAEEGLHIVVSVRDFRAVVQHAGLVGADLRARYSVPERPIQFSYDGDAMTCEFLLMTVGERDVPTPKQIRKSGAGPALDAATTNSSSNTAPHRTTPAIIRRGVEPVPEGLTVRAPGMAAARAGMQKRGTPQPAIPVVGAGPAAATGAARANMAFFDIRPQSQVVPQASLQAAEDGLFVGDDGWEPVRVEEDAEQDDGFGGLGWDDGERPSAWTGVTGRAQEKRQNEETGENIEIAPTQLLSDVQKLGLFYGI
ncbi:hypothetical protein TD95_004660 [Thielaviopsis punctulata]|uniref:DNA repair protein rad9 n=1 Tax=Thielaviopsis punctulata TaxID=72032 RepID=A0A0F4ZL23_9PEZI|nr:hypothetical protein TD95_004660 [Thielaviopsis punctulata]